MATEKKEPSYILFGYILAECFHIVGGQPIVQPLLIIFHDTRGICEKFYFSVILRDSYSISQSNLAYLMQGMWDVMFLPYPEE